MAPNPFLTSPKLLHFPSSLPAVFFLHSPQGRSSPSHFNKALQGTFFQAPVACSASRSPSHIASSNIEPEGTGAAAPSPGERFLEHQHAKATAALVLKQSGSREKKTKKNRRGKAVSSSVAACCYGCGAPLQIEVVDAPGYVDPEIFELKKRHHQLRTILCGRCKLLSHGHMVTAVGGHGGYSGGKQFILAEELREKLSDIRYDKVLIIKLVDIVDFSGSFMARIRDLVGANPIILVVTKVDLLPKGTDLNCVGDWVVEATVKKKLNVISVHLTSSKSLVGIAGVISEIQKERKGRDVYIMGSANVGKSAFISAILKTMATKDPVAAAAHKYKPMQSAVPGTTLGRIKIEAFQGGGKEVGVLLTPPSEKQRELWPGLQSVRQLKIKFEDQKRPASDIAISGLGWISVEPVGANVCQNESVDCRGELQMAVHVPKPVEIFVRPPLPVGSTGAEWYSYQELTEEEEELRPKWYY